VGFCIDQTSALLPKKAVQKVDMRCLFPKPPDFPRSGANTDDATAPGMVKKYFFLNGAEILQIIFLTYSSFKSLFYMSKIFTLLSQKCELPIRDGHSWQTRSTNMQLWLRITHLACKPSTFFKQLEAICPKFV
jgi:hypothetical protein